MLESGDKTDVATMPPADAVVPLRGGLHIRGLGSFKCWVTSNMAEEGKDTLLVVKRSGEIDSTYGEEEIALFIERSARSKVIGAAEGFTTGVDGFTADIGDRDGAEVVNLWSSEIQKIMMRYDAVKKFREDISKVTYISKRSRQRIENAVLSKWNWENSLDILGLKFNIACSEATTSRSAEILVVVRYSEAYPGGVVHSSMQICSGRFTEKPWNSLFPPRVRGLLRWTSQVKN